MIQPFLRRCSVDLFASRLTALLPTYAGSQPRLLPRCNHPQLVASKRLRLSSIQSDRTSSEKSISGRSRSGPSGPSVAGATLVASSPEPFTQEPSCRDPKLQTPAAGSCIPSENPPNAPQASFSRLSLIYLGTAPNGRVFRGHK